MTVAMIFCYFIEFYFTKEFRSYEFHRYIHQIYQISCCMYNLCCNLYYVQKKSLRNDLYEMASSKELHADVFLWILLNFIEQLFYGTSVNGCFCFLQGRTYSRSAIQTLEYCKKVFKINNQKIKTRRLLVSLWLSLTHIWLMFPFWTPL